MRTMVLPALLLALAGSPAGAQIADRDCTACHAELELLRQQAPDMAAARRLIVTHEELALSAHADQSCADCHTGFSRWPHLPTASTSSCASCHEPQDGDWHLGVHAELDEDGRPAADCADCHTVHAVADSLSVHEDAATRLAFDARCIACHETAVLPTWDVHRDTVACSSCHAAHETRISDAASAHVAPVRQRETCGACHEEAADASSWDAHGRALASAPPRGLAESKLRGTDAPPACTSCHGAHGIRFLEDPDTPMELVDRCSTCHVDESDRFYGTYHGKATALGSHVVATCADCHGSHDVFPSDSTASLVHESRLVETCGACHENANASFVGYDSHPDPLDMDRNPPLFFSFVFMNGLLFSVLIVFGLHTLLWWVRILIDHRRGQGVEHV